MFFIFPSSSSCLQLNAVELIMLVFFSTTFLKISLWFSFCLVCLCPHVSLPHPPAPNFAAFETFLKGKGKESEKCGKMPLVLSQ